MSEVDMALFKFNFQTLESITQRPEACAAATRSSRMWEDRRKRLDVFFDNVYHVRSFVSELNRAGLLTSPSEGEGWEEAVQRTLRRMYALLAVVHGCCREPAVLCTVMDRLLEDLAQCVVGHADPALGTMRMARITTLVANLTKSQKAEMAENPGSQETKDRMTLEYAARQKFTELARFYRGAVVIGVANVSTGCGSSEKGTTAWFEGLIRWIGRCRHPSCQDELRLRRLETKQRKSGLSVGVRDRRVGHPDERYVTTPAANINDF